MGYLKWNNRYSVHVDEIDKQHQKLINLINEMYDAMQAGKGGEIIDTVVDRFVDYTVYHFNTEERLLQQHGYPKYDAHKEMHDNIAKKARDLKETLEKGNKPSNIDVMLLLTNWLNAHILEEDKKYAPHIASKANP
ncbi:MAG TPA: bacteriohemerythrin [Nitrospirota bacterium]|nr:bacteriohemerythrin [Nitrospirota bacterium]